MGLRYVARRSFERGGEGEGKGGDLLSFAEALGQTEADLAVKVAGMPRE